MATRFVKTDYSLLKKTAPAPVDKAEVERLVSLLLEAIGEDKERAGLKDTPARVARFWAEFMNYDEQSLVTRFETEAYGQLIAVSGIQVTSLCEHHLLPFSCVVSIAYYPATHILGLSKFARIAQAAAHRLNTQERLTRIIRDTVLDATGAASVLVMTSESHHACMSMRGIEESCASTTVIDVTGVFEQAGYRDDALRAIRMIRTQRSD